MGKRERKRVKERMQNRKIKIAKRTREREKDR